MKGKLLRLSVALALVAALAAAMLPAGVVMAQATWYVDDDNCPGGTGTQADPFCLIQDAIDAATGGDTIVVAAGTYNENNIQIAKSLTIQGAGPGATFVDGGAGDRVFDVGAAGVLTMSGMTIRNGNAVFSDGGGVFNNGTVTMTNCAVTGNTAVDEGGGIFNVFGTLTMTNCTVSGNTAKDNGGGIYNASGTLTITNCTVSGNSVLDYGGGIYNDGTLSMTNCAVSGNTAKDNGGGIYNAHDVTLTMTNCTVSGNSANYGAGIYSFPDGTLTMTNCTVSGNTAAYDGGGIINRATLTMTNCTVTDNSAIWDGGGIYNNAAALTLTCTIVYGNAAGTGPGDVYSTGICNKTESIVGDPDGDPDPLLGPLQNNGGPTETHALLEGTPAIDACVNNCTVATDQRGVHRPQRENCDIGAFEAARLHPATVPAVSLWGIGGMALVLALFLAWSLRRRRARASGAR